MKARLNALKKEKQRNEERKKKNQKQIQFLKTVRQRMYSDRQFKSSFLQKKQKDIEMLHEHANTMRETMIKERAYARSVLKQQKS